MRAKKPEKDLLPQKGDSPYAPPSPGAPELNGDAPQPRSAARKRTRSDRQPRWRPREDLVQTAAASGHFDTLAEAIRSTGFETVLDRDGSFTLFAPTDKAFARMPSDERELLLSDSIRLRRMLAYHVVAEKVRAPRAGSPKSATSLGGGALQLAVEDGRYSVDDAWIVKTNIRASNGVIHAIDRVLTPR